MRTLNELLDETYYNMEKYNQIVIDYVEELEDVLLYDANDKDKLGALSYEITNLLDVYNPKFVNDIEVLEDLQKIITENL